ncbi:MAG TPA: 8-oxoguanine deaminase [Baekduia sp.]|uniref:8-oxoguanine deaminase n=1 Tax=Baekduia sp. TaxID=2600305 RepID=UPI002B71A272|nr:8-oxoguanine deaminase [Baekduia sp.]HMJ32979.1 8-oxoguanine deaminase [Baekduia sp.]
MSITTIEGCAIATVDDARREIAAGHLVLDGDRIVAVGEGPAPVQWKADHRIDASGKLATPGLVNCHHHLYQWATRGYAQDATLFEWLVALYPVWANIDDATVAATARAGLAALARSGCTTSTDHHYIFPRHAGDLLAVEIDAARAIGVRFHPCRGAMDLGVSAGGLPPDAIVEDRDAILTACAEAIDRHHDPSPGARVRIALAPTSPFSVSRELMVETAELARRRGVRLHTHLAETDDEERFCLERFGVRPLQYLDDMGWLGDDVWLAHCVHLNADETARMGATGTGVAHCPTSNGRLGAGIAPVPALLAAGAPVGLGVDGAASNESGELVDELRAALVLARAKAGPRALTARQALELATRHGARCLGRDDELGHLSVGALADVALWDLSDLGYAGIADPVFALAFGPLRPVDLLVVGGEVIVEDGELRTADPLTLAADLARESRRLAKAAP